MISILMKNNKELVISQNAPIYQGENLVDNLIFYVPNVYEDLDLTAFDVEVEYINQANIITKETLTLDSTIVKNGYMGFRVPITNEISKFVGKVGLSLTLSQVIDSDNSYILHSNEIFFNVLKKEV